MLTYRRQLILACVLLCSFGTGCSRAFWRKQADRDAYALLAEKMFDPRWAVPRFNLRADPRSRFYDPFNPDTPPIPPDDEAAHRYMHRLAGFKNYKNWHKFGCALAIENPQWLEPYGLTPQMTIARDKEYTQVPLPKLQELELADAIELSYIHSRDYQTQLENVYLTALELTFQRFQFGVRYLGASFGEPGGDLTFINEPGDDLNPVGRSDLRLNNRFGISQLLPTGGQWAVELANSTLWMFAGPNQSSTASTLSYSLVQPLLFGAGRKVVLANLTQSERDLLYAIRNLAFFRQTFFVDTVSSYLDLLGSRQTIENQKFNIRQLERQLEVQSALAAMPPRERNWTHLEIEVPLVFPETLGDRATYDADMQRLYWSGPMTPEDEVALRGVSEDPNYQTAVTELAQFLQTESSALTVLQLQSQLQNSLNSLRNFELNFANLLDQYKIQLGLPPDIEMTIDESLLEQFELIDDRLSELETRLREAVTLYAGLDEQNPDIEQIRRALDQLGELGDLVQSEAVDLLKSDFERVEADRPDRLESLETDEQRENARRDAERDQRLFNQLNADYDAARRELDELRKLVSGPMVTNEVAVNVINRIAVLREDLLQISQSAQVIQIGLRGELIDLQEFDMERDQAVAYGLENRLDLQNARAAVTDARRQLEVAGNALQATVDVVVEGDINTRSLAEDNNNPLDFRGSESQYRAGLQFQAPLDQIGERNDYRTAQITYQRARRAYMAFEDSVKNDIRSGWRQLNVLKGNFETNLRAVRFSALEFDSAVEQANAPGQQPGGRSAINVLNALTSVLRAQNGLIATWINYEQARLNIYRDMGIMEIEADGVWTDAFYQQLAGSAAHAKKSHPLADPEQVSNETAAPPADLKVPGEVNDDASRPQRGNARTAARVGAPTGLSGPDWQFPNSRTAEEGERHRDEAQAAAVPAPRLAAPRRGRRDAVPGPELPQPNHFGAEDVHRLRDEASDTWALPDIRH